MAVTIGSARNEVLEEWRDVVGFEGIYQVSNLGKLRSVDRLDRNGRFWDGVPLKVRKNAKGYFRTSLCANGKHFNVRVHKLVAEAFLVNDDPEHKIDINHINGIKTDNRVENLEWCTRQYNIVHAWQHGLSKPHPPKNLARGEDAHFAKLKNEDVIYIKTELANGKHTVGEVADLYGVARQTIEKIRDGLIWKHIQIGA